MKKTRNWSEYDESLVNRGSITFWFGDYVLELWNHQNKGYRRERPFVYSDTALETSLIVREVFHLTYRSIGAQRGLDETFFTLRGARRECS